MSAVDVAWDGRDDVQVGYTETWGGIDGEVTRHVVHESAAEVHGNNAPEFLDDGGGDARCVNSGDKCCKTSGRGALEELLRIRGGDEENELIGIKRMALALQASDVAGLGVGGRMERAQGLDGSGDGCPGHMNIRDQKLRVIG